MTILIYGAGGVGAFFGALLVRAGKDVRFVARGAQLEAVRRDGIRIESLLLGPVTVPPVRAVEHAAGLGPVDIVLVCVKAHQTKEILEDLASVVGEGTVIIPLQNGIETDELLADRFGWARVLSAVVYVGATLQAPGEVNHVARGTILIGARPGSDPARLAIVLDALSAAGMEVRVADDIQRQRWEKLLWNASFNPVTAITGRTPGELLEVPSSRALLVGIMREVARVAQASGVPLSEDDVQAQVKWTQGASAIRTSMMVDRERGRAMETDALIGVIVRKGMELGVPTPYSTAVHALLTAVDH